MEANRGERKEDATEYATILPSSVRSAEYKRDAKQTFRFDFDFRPFSFNNLLSDINSS